MLYHTFASVHTVHRYCVQHLAKDAADLLDVYPKELLNQLRLQEVLARYLPQEVPGDLCQRVMSIEICDEVLAGEGSESTPNLLGNAGRFDAAEQPRLECYCAPGHSASHWLIPVFRSLTGCNHGSRRIGLPPLLTSS